MKAGKIIICILGLYLLSVLQTSFFVHFRIWGVIPNLVILLIALCGLLEKTENIFSRGVFLAFVGGFFLDLYSPHFFGFYILISVFMVVAIKIILKKYVRIPFTQRA